VFRTSKQTREDEVSISLEAKLESDKQSDQPPLIRYGVPQGEEICFWHFSSCFFFFFQMSFCFEFTEIGSLHLCLATSGLAG